MPTHSHRHFTFSSAMWPRPTPDKLPPAGLTPKSVATCTVPDCLHTQPRLFTPPHLRAGSKPGRTQPVQAPHDQQQPPAKAAASRGGEGVAACFADQSSSTYQTTSKAALAAVLRPSAMVAAAAARPAGQPLGAKQMQHEGQQQPWAAAAERFVRPDPARAMYMLSHRCCKPGAAQSPGTIDWSRTGLDPAMHVFGHPTQRTDGALLEALRPPEPGMVSLPAAVHWHKLAQGGMLGVPCMPNRLVD